MGTPTRQVITITPEGGMSGLQRKAGQGIDLRRFGEADIRRVSEILWDKPSQRWTVRILLGEFAGRDLTAGLLGEAGLDPDAFPGACVGESGSLTFADYDDGVRAEIAFLDALRLLGRF